MSGNSPWVWGVGPGAPPVQLPMPKYRFQDIDLGGGQAFSSVVEVCFECDMAGCRHIRARRELARDPDPKILQALSDRGRVEP